MATATKSKTAAAKKKGVSPARAKLMAKVDRLADLHAEVADKEKERDGLKKFFRDRTEEKFADDASHTYLGTEGRTVLVTAKAKSTTINDTEAAVEALMKRVPEDKVWELVSVTLKTLTDYLTPDELEAIVTVENHGGSRTVKIAGGKVEE